MSGASTALFLLDDGTGQCEVGPRGSAGYPQGGDVWYGHDEWPSRRQPGGQSPLQWLWGPWFGGSYRYTEQRLAARPSAPCVSVLTKPADGRPFLISGSDPNTLSRSLRYRAAAGLAGFVASCSALTWTLMHL